MVALTHTPFKLVVDQNPKGTGVYIIRHKESGKVYVGSAAVSFRHRWRIHRKQLRENRHHCDYLQHAWNKYGEEAFEFLIIATCAPEWCLTVEQIHMLRLKANDAEFGYNFLPAAGTWLGGKHTDSTKELMRKKWAERGVTPAQKAASTATGQRVFNDPDVRKKVNEGIKRYWQNPNPDHVRKRQEAAASPEAIEKKRLKAIGRKHSPESIKKSAEARRGKKRSAEARANMSAAQKKSFAERPELLDRLKIIAMKGVEAQRPYKSEQMKNIYKTRSICPITGHFLKKEIIP